MQPTIPRKSAVLPLALALMVAGMPALAANYGNAAPRTGKAANETLAVVSDAGWANPTLANAAAESGRALLLHLRSAKAFLAAGSAEGARDALITASEFGNAMERTMPFVVVADDVTSARNQLVAGEEDVFYDDLLPIYTRLDEMQVYAPRLSARMHGKVKQAESQARHGQRQAAAQTLREVRDEMIGTTIYLPLNYVDGQIGIALNALKSDQPDTGKAQAAIDKALGSLVERQLTLVDVPSK